VEGGYHRVKLHEKYPRITMWYEVCVESQLLKENYEFGLKIKKNKNDEEDQISDNSTQLSDDTFDIYVETFRGFKLKFKVSPNTKIMSLKEEIEMKSGMPTGKSRIRTTLSDGKEDTLNSDKTVGDYNLKENDILYLKGSQQMMNGNKIWKLQSFYWN